MKQPKSSIFFKVDADFKAKVMKYCESHDITLSKLARRLIKEELERNGVVFDENLGGKDDERN